MLQILVLGEGVTEIGHETAGEYPSATNAVCPALFRNIADQIAKEKGMAARPFRVKRVRLLSSIPISSGEIRVQGKRVVFGNPPVKRKLASSIILAKSLGCSGIFIQHDRERADGPNYYDFVQEVLQAAPGLLPPDGFLVVANPLRSIETWLLVDRKAVKTVAGVDCSPGLFSKSPEERPSPAQLKAELTRISQAGGVSLPELRCSIAANIDKDTLLRHCPVAAAPFILQCEKFLVS